MTEISFNSLKQYVESTDGEQAGTAVLQLNAQGTFQVSSTDARYALVRSTDDKNRNKATRTAVLKALTSAGLDLNNLTPEMKKAMKLEDFEIKNGEVTSTKPLSDARLRQIMSQAKNFVYRDNFVNSRQVQREWSNIFANADLVFDETKPNASFKSCISGMKHVVEEFAKRNITEATCVAMLSKFRSVAQKLIDKHEDNTLNRASYTQEKLGIKAPGQPVMKDGVINVIPPKYEVAESSFDKEAYDETAKDISYKHQAVLDDVLGAVDKLLHLQIPLKPENEEASANPQEQGVFSPKEALERIVAYITNRLPKQLHQRGIALSGAFGNILAKTDPAAAPAALRKEMASFLQNKYDTLASELQEFIGIVAMETDKAYPRANLQKQIEEHKKFLSLEETLDKYQMDNQEKYLSKTCLAKLEEMKTTIQTARAETQDGHLYCENKLARLFVELKRSIDRGEHILFPRDHAKFTGKTDDYYQQYATVCNKKANTIVAQLTKSFAVLFPGVRQELEAEERKHLPLQPDNGSVNDEEKDDMQVLNINDEKAWQV